MFFRGEGARWFSRFTEGSCFPGFRSRHSHRLRRSSSAARAPRAFSLLEIVASVAIIALLAAISIPSYHAFKRRAEKARCIANLKVLHTGFDSFVLDRNQWPQMPDEVFEAEESDYFAWWIASLQPYGVGEESWLCPSDKVVKQLPAGQTEYASSYAPTHFNPHRYTPFRWNQPWVVERGDFHGRGAHVMMPDGSITTSQSPWGER